VSGWVTLELDDPDEALRPGDTVTGRFAAKWTTRARSVRVQLDYVEETRVGTTVRLDGPRLHLPGGALAGGLTHDFSLTLPADAPATFVARDPATGVVLGCVFWRVAVRLDRFGPDDGASAAIQVSPGRSR
jgi:hypothetical protein